MNRAQLTLPTLRGAARKLLLASVAISLASCELPPQPELRDQASVTTSETAEMYRRIPVSVHKIDVPKAILVASNQRQTIPNHVLDREIDIKLFDPERTTSGLIDALDAAGITIAYRWENPDRQPMTEAVPFRSFKGTLGQLLSVLSEARGIVSWWSSGTIFLSDVGRYGFSVPQNSEVIGTVTEDLKNMGARNIVSSLRSGQVVYSAPPHLQTEVISPYLKRMQRNMAVVGLQVAIVTLSVNDTSATGFDWSSLSMKFDSADGGLELNDESGVSTSTNTSSDSDSDEDNESSDGSGSNSGDESVGSSEVATGLLSTLSGTGLSAAGQDMLAGGVFTVSGAINFLSEFGDAETNQNVEVRTLSGTDVSLRSGSQIPYVSEVNVTSNDSNTSSGTTTETVQSGLTVNLKPFFDGDSEVVTIETEVELNNVLEFRELSAGNEIGSLTQPVTQEQKLENIIRARAGDVVVLGGLRYDSVTNSESAPVAVRNALGSDSVLSGRKRTTERNAVFLILRPTVTIFEEEGSNRLKSNRWSGSPVELLGRISQMTGYKLDLGPNVPLKASDISLPVEGKTLAEIVRMIDQLTDYEVRFDQDERRLTAKRAALQKPDTDPRPSRPSKPEPRPSTLSESDQETLLGRLKESLVEIFNNMNAGEREVVEIATRNHSQRR